jgi:hypothetical protein
VGQALVDLRELFAFAEAYVYRDCRCFPGAMGDADKYDIALMLDTRI